MNDKFYIGVVLSDTCNFDCSYCFLKETNCGKKCSYETLSKIVKWADQINGDVCIRFGHAEPLMEWETLKRIVEEAPSKFSFNFNTNGSLLDKEKLEWFRLNKNRVQIFMSLDGDKDACSGRTRKDGKSLYEAIDIVRLFRENGDIIPKISCTISPYNIDNFYNNFLYLLDTLGIKGFNFSLQADCEWSDEKIESTSRELDKVFYEFAKRFGTPKEFMLIEKDQGYSDDGKVRKVCFSRQKRQIFIDSEGKIYPCATAGSYNKLNKSKYVIGDISKPLDFSKEWIQFKEVCECDIAKSCCLVCPLTFEINDLRKYKNVCKFLRIVDRWRRRVYLYMINYNDKVKGLPLFKAIQEMDLTEEKKAELFINLFADICEKERDIMLEAMVEITGYLKSVKNTQDKIVEKLGLK